VPCGTFYNVILAHVKLYDHLHCSTTKSKRDANIHEQGGRGGGRGRHYGGHGGDRVHPAPGRGSDTYTRPPQADIAHNGDWS
jgi:hypothetical protein